MFSGSLTAFLFSVAAGADGLPSFSFFFGAALAGFWTAGAVLFPVLSSESKSCSFGFVSVSSTLLLVTVDFFDFFFFFVAFSSLSSLGSAVLLGSFGSVSVFFCSFSSFVFSAISLKRFDATVQEEMSLISEEEPFWLPGAAGRGWDQ